MSCPLLWPLGMLDFPGNGSLKDNCGPLVTKRTLGPFVVMQGAPAFGHHLGLCRALVGLGIETCTAKRAIKAFVTAILPEFAGFDPTRENLLVFQKCRQVVGNQF